MELSTLFTFGGLLGASLFGLLFAAIMSTTGALSFIIYRLYPTILGFTALFGAVLAYHETFPMVVMVCQILAALNLILAAFHVETYNWLYLLGFKVVPLALALSLVLSLFGVF